MLGTIFVTLIVISDVIIYLPRVREGSAMSMSFRRRRMRTEADVKTLVP